MTFKIDKNVPIPSRIPVGECPFPFEDMYPDDSFLVPCGDKSLNSTLKYITDWVPKFRAKFKTPRFAIACRATPDKKAVRVWRIPDRDPVVRKQKTNLYAVKRSA